MTYQFWIVIVLTVIINTGMGIIAPVLPTLLKTYGFSTIGLSLPFISLILGRMMFKSLAVKIINAISNKITIVICMLLYGITFYFYSVADSMYTFVALRFFEGVVEGIGIICLTDQVISLSTKNRGQMMGIFGSSFGVGFILGPLIGGVCYEYFGIKAMFYAGGSIGILGAIIALLLPQVKQPKQEVNQSWMAYVVKFNEFIPSYGPSIIRRAVFFSLMILLPLYGRDVLGLDTGEIAAFFTGSAIISSLLMPWTGRLADKYSSEVILAATLSVMAVLIGLFGFAQTKFSFAVLFFAECLAFSLMLPAGLKVFGDQVNAHSQRTVIVSAFGALTEAATLLLAVSLPSLYHFSPKCAWIMVGVICALAAYPFLMQLRSGSRIAAEGQE